MSIYIVALDFKALQFFKLDQNVHRTPALRVKEQLSVEYIVGNFQNHRSADAMSMFRGSF